jgi:hypothetical protein
VFKLADEHGVLQEFSCQSTAVAIRPGSQETGGEEPLEVLCGSEVGGSSATSDRSATLEITLVSDFLEAGLVAQSWRAEGDRAFEWTPNGAPVKVPGQADANTPAQKWTGTVKVLPIEVGGTVNERLTPSVSWDLTSLNLPALYGGGLWMGAAVSGIDAPTSGGLEWKWSPANALPFADLAALKADANVGDAGPSKPNRDFTTGEYAVIKGGTTVHYAATGGWAAGEAA